MGTVSGSEGPSAEIPVAYREEPVAQKTSWAPLKGGGASFKTHRLQVTQDRIRVRRTAGLVLFALAFAGPGLGAALVGAPYQIFFRNAPLTGLFFVLWGGIFGGVGILILAAGRPLTFDRVLGSYYRGKAAAPDRAPERTRQGVLSDIHALQILSEQVSSSSRNGSSRSYTSYELNLVFPDGERLNVMDHGSRESIDESARTLGEFLGVPVWVASPVQADADRPPPPPVTPS